MNSFNRLQWQILLDDVHERWDELINQVYSYFRRHNGRVSPEPFDPTRHSDGQVWVPVGSSGHFLRVLHLHPSKPSVFEALQQKCRDRSQALQDNSEKLYLNGKLIYPPEDDQISLSSIEDYWFNHWQGPLIAVSADPNFSSRFRSNRKLKRGNRFYALHKKLSKDASQESGGTDQSIESEAVFPRIPSLKLETKGKNNTIEDNKSEDDVNKASTSALSSEESWHNPTEEQLSRMHKVVDNEIRTSFSLFSGEAVSRDIVDGTVSLDGLKKYPEILSNKASLLSPLTLPRESRSCPCSPKLSARKLNSQEIHSPKSRSFIRISKLSLSHSLPTVHRQTFNSLVPEFLKSESNKNEWYYGGGDTPKPEVSRTGSFKPPSRRSSCRSRNSQRSISELPEECSEFLISEEPLGSLDDVFAETASRSSTPSRRPLSEPIASSSKLSKLSLSYLVGLRDVRDRTPSDSVERLSTNESINVPVSHNLDLASLCKAQDDVLVKPALPTSVVHCVHALPDVIPKHNVILPNTTLFCYDSCPSTSKTRREGVVNLGFDGTEESSDDPGVSQTEDSGFESRHVSSSQLSTEERSGRVRRSSLSIDLESVDDRCSSRGADDTIGSPVSTLPLDESPRVVTEATPLSIVDENSTGGLRDRVLWRNIESLRCQEEAPVLDDSESCGDQTHLRAKQKPLIMFIHGIGSSADVWTQQLWYFLSCGYEVVAPDLLGHGLSSAPRSIKQYTFDRMLTHVTSVFDQFVPPRRKVILVGHNYGCALALALTRNKPANVSLLILLSSGGPSPLVPYTKYESGVSRSTKLLSSCISWGCLSREFLYAPRGKHFPAVVSDWSSVPCSPRYVVEYTRLGQRWAEGDMSFHRRITMPVLLLYGMKDEQVSFIEMCEMEKAIPRAFLELIPGAGHELMTDRPEDVCHAMHRFIRRWKLIY